ncbi:chemotaxis protein CheA [Natronospirillum operosum]|uniref:Chemotaxis protein CheA n=1 Tax=Natronospirillum operosum TaxID=2759953 RepID=A0A4Z0W7E2_9GAMM|nr:chemotaxis protein CheA [Natronospirillum operosum]TGG93297.1 chemotaxis protein CheA [Natronospirillum operosum]
MDKLMAQFIEEGRDLVGSAAQGLLKLEKAPTDPELLDGLFRDVHTLKGSAGVLELNPMVSMVHVGEELLQRAKEGEGTLDAEAIDVLLDCMDLLNVWLDALEGSGQLPPQAATDGDQLAGRLQAVLTREFKVEAAPDTSAAEAGGEGVSWGLFDDAPPADHSNAMAAPVWVAELPENERRELWLSAARADNEPPLWCLEFRPEADCFFRGDDPLFMVRQTPGLSSLAIDLHAVDEDPAAQDVFQCRLWFGLLARQSAPVLDEHFQYEGQTVSRRPLLSEALVQPSGEPLGEPLDAAVLNDLHTFWAQGKTEALLSSLKVQQELLNPATREASLLRWMTDVVTWQPDDALVFDTLLQALQSPSEVLDEAGRIDWLSLAGARSESRENGSTEPTETVAPEPAAATPLPELSPDDPRLGSVLQDQVRLLKQCREPAIRVGAGRSVRTVLDHVARALAVSLPATLARTADADDLEQCLQTWLGQQATSPAAAPKPPVAAPPPAAAPVAALAESAPGLSDERADRGGRESQAPVIRAFKVDQEQVENLGDLVGELVVAKNALPFLAHRAEQVFGERQLGREIREQYNVINRITRALQDAMMEVQMLPVAHVFDRFPRLVRDLSRKLDKPIDLTIDGEDTEAEKHVIESLADPLVHLMRNAIDHGIESRAERQAAGKDEVGKISLQAWQDNEWVVIEVADDGAGIDPEKTRRKAYEKGLLDERRLHEMTEQEAIELIFMPGFSTLETASDLSGRGVGMDVVRTTIEKSGGRLDVDSRLGEGSRFRLWLPLSMSISQVMQIWIDGQRYGIPMDQVAETVRLPRKRLHQFKDRETVMLRDRVLPVSRAREQLGLEPLDDGGTVALLVVRYRGEPVALMVDDFSEGVEVILKPMEGALEQLGVYQGTALLGDGSVLLVLNLAVMLSSVKLEEEVNDHSGER